MISAASKRLLISLSYVLFSSGVFSQSLYPPKIESPNTASLGKFGEVPVGFFTGIPSIEVPLHTLIYGDIAVPIALRYHPSSVKPGQQTSWVGSGWDLETGGAISRQIKGVQDEVQFDNANSLGAYCGTYYPYPGQLVAPGSERTAIANWAATSEMVYDFFDSHGSSSNLSFLDVEADEFSFNMLGHSGKFFYTGSTGGWKVVSDENIRIEMNGFITPSGMNDIIHSYNLPFQGAMPIHQSRNFSGFTLTVPDGTKFIFGTSDAVEVTSSIPTIYSTGSAQPYTISSWLLKQITDAKGNNVTFNYLRTNPTCVKSRSVDYYGGACYQPGTTTQAGGGSGTYSGGNSDIENLSGTFVWPMYLSNIQSDNQKVRFGFSETSANRYPDDYLKYVNQYSHTTNDVDNSLLGLDYPTNLTRLKWQKLDYMQVEDKYISSLNNYQPLIIRRYEFNYLLEPNRPNKRLMLGSVSSINSKGNTVNKYSFEYNNDFSAVNSNPIYADGNYTDHWGFYNGVDIRFNQSLFNKKQPSQYAYSVCAELLNKITYPTGGFTTFLWEPNDYSQVVDNGRQSLNSSPGIGGGSRIAEIKNYIADGNIATDKKYIYKSGYSSNANPSTLSSSGVLCGTPAYEFAKSGLGIKGQNHYSVGVHTMNGLANYSYTGQGAPVGYKEVTEVNLDGSYTKHTFTSFDADLNGETHFDKFPVGAVGWQTGDNYFPFSSLELERGKPTGDFDYSSNDILLHKTLYAYRNDPARFNQAIHILDNNGSWTTGECIGDALTLATAHYVYTYAYNLTSKTDVAYDEQGNNPVTKSEAYTYNSDNLITSTTTADSKGGIWITSNAYPTDYAAIAPYDQMVAAHIIAPIIQSTATLNGNFNKLVKTNYYQPYSGIFVPYSIQEQQGNGILETKEQVNQVNSKGRVLEIQKPNNIKEVYVWGCNNQHLLAKVTGTDYATVSAQISQQMLDQAGITFDANYTDADVRAELNKIRSNIPSAMVTSYTYQSGVGITSQTDPNNITQYYKYDAFGRLSKIMDHDNKILKKICYSFPGYSSNCLESVYGNDLQSSTFITSGCGTGYTPQSLVYSIEPDTYFSPISQAAANQAAITALNNQGQAAANALPCLITVSGTNFTNVNATVTVTNAPGTPSFSGTYSFTVGASTIANLPAGHYNFTVSPVFTGATNPVTLTINGTNYIGTSVTASNINIAGPVTFNLVFTPQNNTGACSFTMASGYTSPWNIISNSGTSVTFSVSFYSNHIMQQATGYLVGTIEGSCRPSATRYLNTSFNGRDWLITIYPTGEMFWQMVPGSAPMPANTSVSSSSLTYNL